jgi:hypothetical protein
MELVRLRRLSYEGNDHTFIDLRGFSRGYDNDGNDIYHPTRRGVQMKESDFLRLLATHREAPQPTDREVH